MAKSEWNVILVVLNLNKDIKKDKETYISDLDISKDKDQSVIKY